MRDDQIARIVPTTRVRNAIRALVTGAVRTKRDAAKLAQMHPVYFQILCRKNPYVQHIIREYQREMDASAISASALIQKLQIEAVKTIEEIMNSSSSQALRLRAAIDLADRGPETSKVQRHQIETFSIAESDAANIRSAMLESAKMRRLEMEVQEDYEKVTVHDPNGGARVEHPVVNNYVVEPPRSLGLPRGGSTDG